MKAFEHAGFWWDPRDPDTRWPGILRFDPVKGSVLERLVAFHPSQLLTEGREFPFILGETRGGEGVTLLNCFERDHADIFANAVIVGFHAAEPDPPLLIAAAVIEHIEKWWGQSAVWHDASLKPPNYGARYTRPEPVEVHADALMRTRIFSDVAASFEAAHISLGEEIRFEITAGMPQRFSAFHTRVHACQDLLSIASLELCKIEALRLSPPSPEGRPKTVGDYYAVPVFKDPSERWPSSLFRYADIAGRARDVFTAWFENAERLSAVRSLYLSAAYGKAFLELKLLALAQAAEAYHRRMYENQDRYMDAAAYEKNVYEPLKAAIPANLDASHRQSLKGRLKFGNEFSFRRRLTMLFEENEAALATVVPDPCDWIGRIVEYRNNLTHHPVVEDRPAPERTELVQINYVLRILLELCFLSAMSFSSDDIRKRAAACGRYEQIRERFFPGKP